MLHDNKVKNTCVYETLCPATKKVKKKKKIKIFGIRSNSMSQGNWPLCHLKGHYYSWVRIPNMKFLSLVIANVKVDNRQGKNPNMPPIIPSGGIYKTCYNLYFFTPGPRNFNFVYETSNLYNSTKIILNRKSAIYSKLVDHLCELTWINDTPQRHIIHTEFPNAFIHADHTMIYSSFIRRIFTIHAILIILCSLSRVHSDDFEKTRKQFKISKHFCKRDEQSKR